MPRPYKRKRDFNYAVCSLLSPVGAGHASPPQTKVRFQLRRVSAPPVGARHASPLQTKERFQLRRVSAPLSCRGEGCLAPTKEKKIFINPRCPLFFSSG